MRPANTHAVLGHVAEAAADQPVGGRASRLCAPIRTVAAHLAGGAGSGRGSRAAWWSCRRRCGRAGRSRRSAATSNDDALQDVRARRSGPTGPPHAGSAPVTAPPPGRPPGRWGWPSPSSGVSQASSAPWCMTAIRSARSRITSMWCSTMSTARPLSRGQRPDHLDQRRHVLGADPGHRLVQQHHPRLAGQQQGDLQLAFLAVGQGAGQRRTPGGPGRPGRAPRRRRRRPPGRPPPAATAASSRPRCACTASRTFSRTRQRAEHRRRTGRCGPGRAGPAGAAASAGDVRARPAATRPVGGPAQAGDQVEQRGLAGAVRPDHARGTPRAPGRGRRCRRWRPRRSARSDPRGCASTRLSPSSPRPAGARLVAGRALFGAVGRERRCRCRSAWPGTSAGAARGPRPGRSVLPLTPSKLQPSSALIILSTSSPPWPAARARPSGRRRSRPGGTGRSCRRAPWP